jgi:UDP-N-acetylglucosamine--N-acetylmuramyl-(pentapeptide) pyrophosphoryl-undecaprenol N-acetylglucosamine transferase
MKVLVAGGGTGGHLYPGIALAEELRARGDAVEFVGTERGIEVRAVPRAGFPLRLITVSGLKSVGAAKLVSSLFKLPVSFLQCVALLRQARPDVVVGVGGYASGPVVMTAWIMRIPTVVLEQNSIPGFTNQVLGRVVGRVFGSFNGAASHFPAQKYVRAGNPIRAALASAATSRGHGILVLGGSQGAHALNVALPTALEVAFQQVPPVPVVHQAGEKDVAEVTAAYASRGIPATVSPFIDDMASAYAACRLCVCRAGATTCAELTTLGKPSVMIPFPQAADDHQTVNARELEEAGACVVVPQSDATPERLGTLVAQVLGDEARLDRMAQAALALGRPHAARQVADALHVMTDGGVRP